MYFGGKNLLPQAHTISNLVYYMLLKLITDNIIESTNYKMFIFSYQFYLGKYYFNSNVSYQLYQHIRCR